MKNKSYSLFFLLIVVNMYSQNSSKISDEEYKTHLEKIQKIEQTYPDSALALSKKLLPKISDNFSRKAYLFIEMGQCYSFLGQKEQALSSTLQAKEMALQTDDDDLKAKSILLLVYQYKESHLIAKAKKEIDEGLIYLNRMPKNTYWSTTKSAYLWQYGVILRQENKIDSSIVYFRKSMEPLLKAKQENEWVKMSYNIAYAELGTSYFQLNNLDFAEKYALKSITGAENSQINSREIINESKLNLSLIYYKRKQYQRAIDTLKSIEKGINDNEYPRKAQVYNYLAKNYLAKNDFKTYQKYNDQYISIKDKLSREDIKVLNKTLRLLDNEMKEESHKNILDKRILMGLLLFSIVMTGLLIFHFQRKRKKEKQLFQNIISKLEHKLKENINSTVIAEDFPKEDSPESTNNPNELQKNRTIPESVEKEILQKLKKFEQSEKFINPKLSLSLLALQFNTNTNYLSEVINTHKGKNYNSYINELRVEYICNKIITQPEFRNYKISYLAEVCGFSSYAVFTTVFKNITEMSPSSFIKQAVDIS